MSDAIRVRVYNVRFGDAILVTVPDRDPATGDTTERHLLIDVGNVLMGEGGADAVFDAVVDDVLAELAGRPLDLYVMTHEHLDHVQGLFHAERKSTTHAGQVKAKLKVDSAWLTGSAALDYYDTHPDAKKEKKVLLDAFDRIEKHLAALPADEIRAYQALLANNNPRSTADCIDFLRTLAAESRTHFVHRGFATAGKHPFKEAKFEIWAPEEDTSDYYRNGAPLALEPMFLRAQDVSRAEPPAGVDAGAFYDLVAARERGFVDNLLAIDKAANDTSVVFCLEWRGKRLLFAGDAELRSWKMMHDKGVLKPVDFLKVSHHGSHNGTPDGAVLDAFFSKLPGQKKRLAVASTWPETYPGIPHGTTDDKLRTRAKLIKTTDDTTKPWVDTLVTE